MSAPPTAVPQRVLPGTAGWALHDVAASRAIEAAALAQQPPHALMQRAGQAVARLALAVAPHARQVWVACGPGNNGGDGLVAATLLQRAGRSVSVSLYGDAQRLPDDALHAWQQALQAGVQIAPPDDDAPCELAIDALLGLGASRAPQGGIAAAIERLNGLGAPILAVDLPSGLSADTGQRLGSDAVRATHTLSLLTLKPGLFTAAGRDHAGQIWLDTLGVAADGLVPASARLAGAGALELLAPRAHASHKGSFGDLLVVGGAPGMGGAALLAARAALASGAGRVFVSLLDASAPAYDGLQPELMLRRAAWRGEAALPARGTVVCGCGGGGAVRDALPALLSRSARLVLDADALNAIAADESLRQLLDARAAHGRPTVLTPHPLEAARLLGCDAAAVQADRLRAAHALAQRHRCVVLLKGSGSVIAGPEGVPTINPSGNGLLAGGGTGDVLAGWIGGFWAQAAARDDTSAARRATEAAAWLHGRAADRILQHRPGSLALRAGELSEAMRETAAARGSDA
ncbi:MAG TPA: NAD(P)H-hydrate dehydratase [Rubrivivax sp.]|nr:NAD(P)H-hydrate dehydratase [Rubrivivax sp.]